MTPPNSRIGIIAGILAFASWGFLPVYWKALGSVPALELLAHRIFWSLVMLLIYTRLKTSGEKLISPVLNRRSLTALLSASLVIATNWLVYVWAVTHNRVLEASLGYFITPLFNVLLGAVVLKENLSGRRKLAVLLATVGVVNQIIVVGSTPWVALLLALSFGSYGLIKKKINAGAFTGLTRETMLLSIPAVGYLFYLESGGNGSLFHSSGYISILLIGSGLVTALPLLLFTRAVRSLPLSTVGFIQYLAPTCMFFLGVVVYNESFTTIEMVTFGFIWSGLLLYSSENYRVARKQNLL